MMNRPSILRALSRLSLFIAKYERECDIRRGAYAASSSYSLSLSLSLTLSLSLSLFLSVDRDFAIIGRRAVLLGGSHFLAGAPN